MDVGVISDIHGNKVALEAVLRDMPPVDCLVCAGDVVGYNPWHGDCVDAVRDATASGLSEAAREVLPDGEVQTVLGNHDRAVATGSVFGLNSMAAAGVRYAQETLTDDQLAWLAELPEERTACDGRIKVVHGHPDHPDRYTYPDEYDAGMLDDEDVLVTGHTHVPGHSHFEAGVVMNPGSVGQPRDNDPRAAYAVVDLATLTVDQYRVEYDIDRVAGAITDADLPVRLADRLKDGR
jgi:putative phosphoesterase